MSALFWLVLAMSFAKEPSAEESVAGEVIVYADLLVERARNEVVAALEQQGYTDVKRRDGYSVMMHQRPYKGQVFLYDDGRMEFRRQSIRFGPHKNEWAEKNKALAWLTCWTYLCTRPGGVLVGKRKFKGYEDRLVRSSQSTVHTWNERLADRGLGVRLDTLPDLLQKLWDEGLPLEGEAVLATHSERRAAIYAFWSTRTDTPHGEAVRQAVEGFVRGVVQTSEHPFPADEDGWFARATSRETP